MLKNLLLRLSLTLNNVIVIIGSSIESRSTSIAFSFASFVFRRNEAIHPVFRTALYHILFLIFCYFFQICRWQMNDFLFFGSHRWTIIDVVTEIVTIHWRHCRRWKTKIICILSFLFCERKNWKCDEKIKDVIFLWTTQLLAFIFLCSPCRSTTISPLFRILLQDLQ